MKFVARIGKKFDSLLLAIWQWQKAVNTVIQFEAPQNGLRSGPLPSEHDSNGNGGENKEIEEDTRHVRSSAHVYLYQCAST
jgi:hypothetical protein